MSLRISEIVERGFYPGKINLHEGKVELELIKLGHQQFDNGFYSHELEKAAGCESVHVDLDDIQIDVIPHYQPAGYIYHLGRCGSTVAVNMFNSLEQCQVISESQVFPDLIAVDVLEENGEILERRKKITTLFCLLGEKKNCRTIFKMASWEVHQGNVHFQLYPEVKSCLIVRNILEILVSILREPPSRYMRNHMRSRIKREKSQGIDDLLRMQTAKLGEYVDYFKDQLYVDFIGSAMQGLLLDVIDSTAPYLVIDHKDVVNRVPTDLCAYFDIHPDEKQIQVMQHSAGYYSKANNKNERYFDDSSRKAAEATPETRRWCEQILQPMLEEIIKNNITAS